MICTLISIIVVLILLIPAVKLGKKLFRTVTEE